MGRKKVIENESIEKVERVKKVEKDLSNAPLSALLTEYGLWISRGRERDREREEEVPAIDASIESRLMDGLHDVLSSVDELRVVAVLWIEATFPSGRRRSGNVDTISDALHAAFDPTFAFAKARVIDACMKRGLIKYQENLVFGMPIDQEKAPYFNREITLAPAFLQHVASCDDDMLGLTGTGQHEVKLITFDTVKKVSFETMKLKYLKRHEVGITLEDHFLEPDLQQRVHVAASGENVRVRTMMREAGVYNGPAKAADDHACAERNVVLLYGPPGTGKTSVAYAIAGELQLPLLALSVDDVLSPYWGESERNIRAAFNEYRKAAEALGAQPILLMDECDSLMNKRQRGGRSPVQEGMANVVNIVLQEIEAFQGTLIMTTNNIDFIDEAFARRVDESIQLDYPSKDVQKRMWKRYLSIDIQGASAIDIDVLVEAATLTGAHIVKCVSSTVEKLLRQHGRDAVLTTDDLLHEIHHMQLTFDSNLRNNNLSKQPFGFVA